MPEIERPGVWDKEVEDELVVDLAVAAGHLKLIVRIVGLQAVPAHHLFSTILLKARPGTCDGGQVSENLFPVR